MFSWWNSCTTLEHVEQPSTGLWRERRMGLSRWFLVSISYSQTSCDSPVWGQEEWLCRIPGDSLMDVPRTPTTAERFGGGQGGDTGQPGWCPRGTRRQPDPRHSPCENSLLHQTSCIQCQAVLIQSPFSPGMVWIKSAVGGSRSWSLFQD